MTKPAANLMFSHMGLSVRDVPRMEKFYTEVLGFTVTDRGQGGGMDLVFLSRDPMDHHQIVLNSAGIGAAGMTAGLSLADLQAMLDVNVRAPILFAQAAIPHLSSGGRIISIGSSMGERVPFPGVTAYAMSKSALLSFTRGLSRELGPQGITWCSRDQPTRT